MASIQTKRAYLVAASTLGTCCLLLGLEICARFVVEQRDFSRADFYGVVGPENVNMLLQTDWGGDFVDGFSDLMEADSALVWRLRPNLNLGASALSMDLVGANVRPSWTINTDHRGFRVSETPSEYSSSLHVVGVGDSSTFGWGLDRPFLSRLDAQTTNLGVPGYSSEQGLLMARGALPRLKPDVVVLSFGANDAHKVAIADRSMLRSRATLVGRLRFFIGQTRMAMLIRDRIGSAATEGAVERVSPPEFRENVEALVAEVRELGAQPVLLSWCANEPWERVLIDVGRETGLPLIREREVREYIQAERDAGRIPQSVLGEFSDIYDETVLNKHPILFETNDGCHPSVWSHQVLAERLQSIVDAR